MKLAALAVAASAAALTVAFAGVGSTESAQAQTAPRAGITTTGTGSVRTTPNRAQFTFGVTSTGRTASAALSANAAEMARVIAALKNAGVAAADIQTQYVSVSPRTNENGETIVGYTAHNSVSATIRQLSRAGAVIDAAVNAGANEVSGPNLTRSDSAALYHRALRAAVANARAKALVIARASGRRLGRVVAVVEGGGDQGFTPSAQETRAADSVPIEAGTSLVRASVSVTFALR